MSSINDAMSIFSLIAFSGRDVMLGHGSLFSTKRGEDIYSLPGWRWVERSRLTTEITASIGVPIDISTIIADCAGSRHWPAIKKIGYDYYACAECDTYPEPEHHNGLCHIKESLKNGSNLSQKAECRLVRKFVAGIAKLIEYPEPPHPMLLPNGASMMPELIELLETIDYAFDKINNDIDTSDEDDDRSQKLTDQGIELIKDTFYRLVLLVWP